MVIFYYQHMLGKKWEMNQSRTVVVVFYSLVGFMCYIFSNIFIQYLNEMTIQHKLKFTLSDVIFNKKIL